MRLPARIKPDRSRYIFTALFDWGSSPLYYRGRIEAYEAGENWHLVITLRDLPWEAARHRVTALYLNGQQLDPLRVSSYRTVLARSTEVIFDVGRFLRPGVNLVAFAADGTSGAFNLDMYEVRWNGTAGS